MIGEIMNKNNNRDGEKQATTPSQKQKTETNNYINICFFKYLKLMLYNGGAING